jgi:hypothetical protein
MVAVAVPELLQPWFMGVMALQDDAGGGPNTGGLCWRSNLPRQSALKRSLFSNIGPQKSFVVQELLYFFMRRLACVAFAAQVLQRAPVSYIQRSIASAGVSHAHANAIRALLFRHFGA